MILEVKRTKFSPSATLGELWIDGTFFCHTLEDTSRGLDKNMPEATIKKLKVYGLTAIPKGWYELTVNYSGKFKRSLPLLLNVPGYLGIRIHPGNKAEHTLGCILVGDYSSDTYVVNSKKVFDKLFKVIEETIKKEKIFVIINEQHA
jgi:hypothetical protein